MLGRFDYRVTPTTKNFLDIVNGAGPIGFDLNLVDVRDVVAGYEVASKAGERARQGQGPTLIECKTYRHRRHTERANQPDKRPRAEIEEWMGKDPIERLVQHLMSQQGQLSEAEWQAMDAEILQRIEASVTFAKNSSFPAPSAALEDVFAASTR